MDGLQKMKLYLKSKLIRHNYLNIKRGYMPFGLDDGLALMTSYITIKSQTILELNRPGIPKHPARLSSSS